MRLTANALTRKAMSPTSLGDLTTTSGGGGSAVGAGFNVNYTFRMTVDQLRMWYQRNPLIRRAVAVHMDKLRGIDWVVGPKDPKLPYDEDVAQLIAYVLEHPDPTRGTNLGSVHAKTTKDLLVLDAGTIRVRFDAGTDLPIALQPVDAGRIEPVPEWSGTGPRYRVLNKMGTDAEGTLDSRELMYLIGSESSYSDMGEPAMLSLYRAIAAEWDTFKSIHILQKKRTPPGLIMMPNATPEQVDEVADMFITELEGKMGVGVASVPAGTTYQMLGSVNIMSQGAFQFYQMIVNLIASAFGTTPVKMGFTQDTWESTGKAQMETSDEGSIALMQLWEDAWNGSYVPLFPNSDNIVMRYPILHTRMDLQSAQIAKQLLGSGVTSVAINDVRMANGDPSLEYDDPIAQAIVDEPLILYQMMWLPVSEVAKELGKPPAVPAGPPAGNGTAPPPPEAVAQNGHGQASGDQQDAANPGHSAPKPPASADQVQAQAKQVRAWKEARQRHNGMRSIPTRRSGHVMVTKDAPEAETAEGKRALRRGLAQVFGSQFVSVEE